MDRNAWQARTLVCLALLLGVGGCLEPPLDDKVTAGCSGGTSDCDDGCVIIESDPEHCGGCNQACASAEVCLRGQCAAECSGSRATECDGGCVDTSSDANHCGGCGQACRLGQACAGGACFDSCEDSGRVKCEGQCVELRWDSDNCGECQRSCDADMVCDGGQCVDECSGFGVETCGGRCVDTTSHPSHCGACGAVCASGEVCSEGLCVGDCAFGVPDACGGACVDTRSDPAHCGVCGRTCAVGEVCLAGACVSACGGSRPLECAGRCIDPMSDATHCGRCSQQCASGQVCSAGRCQETCSEPGAERCGNGCVMVDNDALHCGACGRSCEPGAVCSEGVCASSCREALATRCDDACVYLESNLSHCGACGRSCAADEFCVNGECESSCPTSAPLTCGRSCVDEAEALLCLSPCGGSTPDRCDAGCYDLSTSQQHCGACGRACEVGQTCVAGECHAACASPQALCAEDCVDLRLSADHCGSCGNYCASGEICRDSRCQPSIEQLVASQAAACALSSDHRVFCWGRHEGQFGAVLPLEYAMYSIPKPASAWVEGLEGELKSISLGRTAGCAVTEQGALYCWGQPSYGMLGIDWSDQPTIMTARRMEGWPEMKGPVAIGRTGACAITSEDELICWGTGARGGARVGEYWDWQTVEGLHDLVGVVAAESRVCARRSDGAVFCFGSGNLTPDSTSSTTPVELTVLSPLLISVDPATSMALGTSHSCMIVGAGEVACWGQNSADQLGGEPSEEGIVRVPLPEPARAVAASASATCAALTDGSLHCWGRDEDAYQEDRSIRELVTEGATSAAIAEYMNFAILESGRVLSWGGCGECLSRSPVFPMEPRECCEFPED